MERHRQSARRPAPGGLNSIAMSRPGAKPLPDLPNIESRVDGKGQITIGAIHPIRCVAIANDSHNSLVMLVRREGETLTQLLIQLDAAIAKAYDEAKFTDEVNVPPPPQTPARRRLTISSDRKTVSGRSLPPFHARPRLAGEGHGGLGQRST